MKDKCTAVAAVRLMLHHPFWHELFYSMEVIEVSDDPRIRTLATNGSTKMWVNPEFWATLSLDLKVSALAHEIAHKMLHHCTRMGHRDEQVWMYAADVVVNTLLAENKFPIGADWVPPQPKYKGWTVEAVYNDIIRNLPPPPKGGGKGQGSGKAGDKPQPDEGSGGDEGSSGSGDEDSSGSGDANGKPKPQWDDLRQFKGSPEQVEAQEAKTEQQVAKALTTARAMGTSPLGVDMATQVAYTPKREPWYNHLQRYMQSLSVAEFNWARMNRRYAVLHGICAPHNYHESLDEVVLAIDASGSVYDVASQANFAGHVNAILAEAKPKKVHVVYFDTQVHKHEELDPGAIEFESRPKGGGGTSFVDIFDWAEREGIKPAVCIVLTDLEGTFPRQAPDYPVVWASIVDHVAPFGDTILVE